MPNSEPGILNQSLALKVFSPPEAEIDSEGYIFALDIPTSALAFRNSSSAALTSGRRESISDGMPVEKPPFTTMLFNSARLRTAPGYSPVRRLSAFS